MAAADLAVNFAYPTVNVINLAILIFALAVEVMAFGHCLMQRPDAFNAVGTLPKTLWLALTGGGLLLTLLVREGLGPLVLIGIIAGLVYLLDVRPAIRDITDGSGPW